MRDREEYWFPAKRYGWGWGPPRKWQGWAVLAGFIGLLSLLFTVIPPEEDIVSFLVATGGLTALLLLICWMKGEPPRWRWGNSEFD
jgi:hypothetical protein